jgi:hypothetical protein
LSEAVCAHTRRPDTSVAISMPAGDGLEDPCAPESWPTRSYESVFHVGSLKAQDKGTTHNRLSWEGNGLSVSRDPQAWRQIARLGGQPTWRLKAPAGSGGFVDAHALTAAHWGCVLRWGVQAGYARSFEAIEVSWLDDELGGRCALVFDAECPREARDAHAEFEDRQEQDAQLRHVTSWRGAEALALRLGFKPLGNVEALVLTLFVEDVLFALAPAGAKPHGTWWADALDVAAYSAPRGVIHKKAVSQWLHNAILAP